MSDWCSHQQQWKGRSHFLGAAAEALRRILIDKARNRRYATPKELAADIQRHLGDEPVTAVAPSRVYRLKKFARGNRMAVALALVIMLGTFASVSQAIRATRSERRALSAQSSVEAVLRFLQVHFLTQVDPFLADAPGCMVFIIRA